ncbi:TNF receptor-associated factor 6-like [Stylophora pistillata]|uniref:TNF receptor-associated factor 6-like n=1 Tax=Stylophora pistillata TaxID=50429 RepID=UPI000C050AD8|nr:TNF receptor-associated factor 6-like [Stylophora pistillata]
MGMGVHSNLRNDLWESTSGGYDEEFERPLEEGRHVCPICRLGLREPFQTSCGHRFCKGCIRRSMRDAGRKCPLDNEPLSEAELYPDNFAKREVMNLKVFCRMKQRGCAWKGELGKLQEHLIHCDFVDVWCSKTCGREMPRKDLKEHLEKECPNRTKPCINCKKDIKLNELEDHVWNCPTFPVKGDSCKEENVAKENLLHHLEDGDTKVFMKCRYNRLVGCTFEGRPADVEAHVKEVVGHKKDMASDIEKIVVTG